MEENVLKCTTTVWVRIYVIKLWNSNKQGALKTIAKQYLTNEQGVITTEINRTAVVVSCRSNNAIVDPFVIHGNDYWNAKIQNISGNIPKNTYIYVAFFYFE